MESAVDLPRWARAAITRRRPEVLGLSVLFAGAAAMLAVAVAFPMSEQAPVELASVMLGVALALAAGVFLAGDRLPPPVLIGAVVFAALCNTAIVAASHTTAGVMGDGLAYVWLTVYLAVFFPRTVLPFALFATVIYGGGILVSGVDRMLTGWAVLSLSTVSLGFVVGRVSEALRKRVHTDSLTGILNREGLAEAADRAFGRARRRSDEIAIAVVDLDAFKEVNDREGHASGDRLLRDATAAWRSTLRTEDVLARTGGDEFVLLLPRTAPDDVPLVLRRLEDAHPVAWSVGVTQWRQGESLADCLERADQRLYEHKRR